MDGQGFAWCPRTARRTPWCLVQAHVLVARRMDLRAALLPEEDEPDLAGGHRNSEEKNASNQSEEGRPGKGGEKCVSVERKMYSINWGSPAKWLRHWG